MKSVLVTLSLLLTIVLGFSLTTSRSQVATASSASPQVERAAPAPALTGSAVDQLQLDSSESVSCEQSATSDAATCSAGGWVFRPDLGCCSLRTGLVGKWRKGASTKCCGGCAM